MLIGVETLEGVDAFCYSEEIQSPTACSHQQRHLTQVKRTCLQSIRSILLYASETWPAKADDINQLIRTDNSMVRWICSVKLSDRKSSSELRSMIGLQDLESVFRFNWLRWYGHTQRMAEDNWPKKIINHDIGGKLCNGGQRKHWIHNIDRAMKHLRIERSLVQDRVKWSKAIRQGHGPDDVVQPSNLGKRGR